MKKKFIALLLGALVGTSFMFPISSYAFTAGNSTGPNSKVLDGPYTWNHACTGGGGGYVPAIIFNQSEKDLVYARTDMGGAYRWDSEKNQWIGLSDFISADDWNDLGCESLATDPVDPNRVYIAAGTYTNDWTSDNGSIFISEDKGNSWQQAELPFKLGGNMPGRCMGERLVIDPVCNNILYLGTRDGNGLWKSTDYGHTWNKVESFTHTGDYIDDNFKDTIGVVWEVFDKTSSKGENEPCQTIYVGVADKENSIYVTHDAGETWAPLEGQPNLENQKSWVKKNDSTNQFEPRAFLPQHGVLDSEGNLYITYSNDCGPYDGTKGDVWKYNTKTGEWKNISPVPSSDLDNNYFGYGGIAIDNNNPGTLVVASLNSWWPDTKFFRSTDYGETWTPIWEWNGYPDRKLNYSLDISKAKWLDFGKQSDIEPAPKLGWMTGCVAIDPFNSDKMLYGTGATIYGTNNLTDWGTDKKVNISVMANGIEETSVLCLISPGYKDVSVITGEGDVTGFVHKDLDTAPQKMHQPTFNTESMDFAQNANNFIVRVGSADTSSNQNAKSISFSYDGGENWFTGNYINGNTGMKGGTVAASSDAKKVVWAPSNQEAYYTTDNGNSWNKCNGLPSGANVISDRVNENKFYGLVNGDFYVSTDGAETFTKTASSLPESAKLKAVPDKEGNIWIAGGNDGVFFSNDSGKTFTKLDNIESAETIGYGKAKAGSDYPAIYTNARVNGIKGFFRSDDCGKTWTRINDDKNQFGAANADISGDPNIYGRVYIATNGLGLVYGDLKDSSDTPALKGDVHNDGNVDSMDYTILKSYIDAGNTSESEISQTNSDVNNDGKISFLDLIALKNLLNK